MKALWTRWVTWIVATLSTARALVEADLAMYRRQPRLWSVSAGMVLVPTIYALVYLSSVWDPMKHTDALTAAVVDQDRGATIAQHEVRLGRSLVDGIVRAGKVRVRRFDRVDDARRAVREGRVAFAITIDEDFSQRATHAAGETALVHVYISEGNSSLISMFARRFASEVAAQVNTQLARERWRAVLGRVEQGRSGVGRMSDAVHALHSGSASLRDGLDRAHTGSASLADGARRASDGARALADGSARASAATTALTDGVQRLGDGLRELDARMPSDEELRRLTQGAHGLAEGSARLREGTSQLAQGASSLRDGASALARGSTELRAGVARIPIWGGRAGQSAGRVVEGAQRLSTGAAQLAQGALSVRDGSAELARGSERLDHAVTQLSDGSARVHGAVHQMATALPVSDRLHALRDGASQLAQGSGALRDGLGRVSAGATQLEDGLSQLHAGSERLEGGLAQLEAAIPRDIARPEGTAESLATSVSSEVTVAAPVSSNAAGFAPYFLPLSLWLGAVMCAFVFHLRRVPASVAGGPRAGLWLGKLAWPSTLVLAQSLSIALSARCVLSLPTRHTFGFALTLMVTSLVFLRLVVALQRWFGDSGKGLALLVMVTQLSSAGGPYPIELSAMPFQRLHPYMPFTHALEALRAAMFGAYDGRWKAHVLKLVATGLLVALGGAFAGRWRVVDDRDYGPAVDLE
jgi:putative membrane protein